MRKYEISQDYDSADERPSKKSLSRVVRAKIAEARAQRAYKKSPEGREEQLREINQELAIEQAKTKRFIAKSARRKAQVQQVSDVTGLNLLGVNDANLGMQKGILNEPDSYGGFDSMFGPDSMKPSMKESSWGGMNDMLGFGGMGKKTKKSGWGGMNDLLGI